MREEIMDILEWLVESYDYAVDRGGHYQYETACDKLMELLNKRDKNIAERGFNL